MPSLLLGLICGFLAAGATFASGSGPLLAAAAYSVAGTAATGLAAAASVALCGVRGMIRDRAGPAALAVAPAAGPAGRHPAITPRPGAALSGPTRAGCPEAAADGPVDA